MDDKTFEKWKQNSDLSSKALEEISEIRRTPPSRRVGDSRYSVTGRFSSKKMKSTIQFESHKVELPYIYQLEHNDDVLEFYDQPLQLKVNHITKNGKKSTFLYTPDFFVIEKNKAYWVECKREEELLNLLQKDSTKYSYVSGRWSYLPGERYAEELGIGFEVFTSENINWIFQRNLTYIEDYFTSDWFVDEVSYDKLQKTLIKKPGVTLKSLEEIGFSKQMILSSLANNLIYVDLNTQLLKDTEKVNVFLSNEQMAGFQFFNQNKIWRNIEEVKLKSGELILWGEAEWEIVNCDNKFVFLVSFKQEALKLPLGLFEDYVQKGHIRGVGKKVNASQSESMGILESASESELKVANDRYEAVMNYLEEKDLNSIVTKRTIRSWVKKFKDAQIKYGNGYIGLIPSTKKKGNKKRRFPKETLDLMNEIIETSYYLGKSKSAKVVYGEFALACKERRLYAPSYRSFCEEISNINVYVKTRERKGRRAAYNNEEFYKEERFTSPKHGERALELAHIDHTQLDVEVEYNEKESKRPWCTCMIDAYSRKVLALVISFDPPSYVACMNAIRDCVRKHNRLPNSIVVDGGKEFNSIYFESLLAMHSIHKKERPPGRSRYGNVGERFFGTINELFIHNLEGNTKITKNVRQVTKSVNPKEKVVWKLELLIERMELWIEDVYHNKTHSTTFESPNERFNDSLRDSGVRERRYIPYDETFMIMTLPSPRRKTRKVHVGRGVKLNYAYYWCDAFRDGGVEEEDVEIKYDPYDISVCYVYVHGRWEKCFSEQYKILSGKTERELKIITDKIREKQKSYSRIVSINAQMIAKFIIETEHMENNMEEFKRANESNDGSENKNSEYTSTDAMSFHKDEIEIDESKLKLLEGFDEFE
ncbi:TnsA endonuclease N-terminal domain-containing protein [Salimicrobium flavidum]|nr:TnsA endonuclease N-terminal domain-containing protein [Salimicrobium flavidum]